MMDCCCNIKLQVIDKPSVKLKVIDKPGIKLKICTEGGGGHWAPYLGPYRFIPKTFEQKLETKNKLMSDDVTCEEIPYIEVSNEYGTTTIIATD